MMQATVLKRWLAGLKSGRESLGSRKPASEHDHNKELSVPCHVDIGKEEGRQNHY